MNYRLPNNVGYIIRIMRTAWNIKCIISKIKEKERSLKYVAQQRVYLIKKEGTLLSLLPNKRMFSLFWISGLNELKKQTVKPITMITTTSSLIKILLKNLSLVLCDRACRVKYTKKEKASYIEMLPHQTRYHFVVGWQFCSI